MLSRAAAAGLAGLGLALLLSWLAALAMNHDVLPGTDVRLAALVCCGLACLAAGALSPRPEQGRALGGAMTWAVWAIGYLILKATVGAYDHPQIKTEPTANNLKPEPAYEISLS